MSIRIRRLEADDVEHIKQLHEKYYSEFEFPDFFNRFLSRFAIVDEKDEIVIAGGVRPIAETVIITDPNKSEIKIGRALIESLRCSLFTCARANVDELHAFVTNASYASHLERHGFSRRSPALSVKVSYGER